MSGVPPPAATGAKPEDEDKVRAEAKEIVERAKKDLGLRTQGRKDMKALSADKKDDIQALINRRVAESLGDRPKEAPKPAAPAAAPAAAPPKKLSVAEEAAANKAEAAGIVKEAQKAYDARIADREKAKTASKDELQKLIDLKISGGAAPAAEEKKAE